MEEILDIYKKPYDPQCPQVCMDEMSTQLIGEVREPLPVSLGSRCDMTQSIREMGPRIFLWLLNH